MNDLVVTLVSGVLALLTAVATSVIAYYVQRDRLKTEVDNALSLQRDRLGAELDNALLLQRERLRTELRTEFMAEEAVRQLLRHPRWPKRSFGEIKRRLGGFDDDELRRLLVRAGAIRFGEKESDDELWGLRERNEGQL